MNKRLTHLATLLYVLLLAAFTTDAMAADSPYGLEIIQPQAGLTTTNRFYKAYPGLTYNVRVAVTGGVYPYSFTLTSAPSGMTINASTGEVNWPSPAAQSTAYPVGVQVTDGAGAKQSVSWTILVTTQKFLFVDAVNGKDGATGTIDDPVKGFVDVYGGNVYDSKWSTKMKDYFVYIKNGTYSLAGYTGGTAALQYTNNQPMVWLAYPGTRPVIEMSSVFLQANTKLDNFYVDGFEIKDIACPAASEYRMAFRIGGDSSNVTFRKNYFHNMPTSSGSYNQSAIMISRAESTGKYWSIQDNEFYDLHHSYGLLGYTAQKVLVEDNYFHSMDGHAIGPKIGTSYWFMRHNRVISAQEYGIWLMYEPYPSTSSPFGEMEVSFNYVQMSSGNALDLNQSLSLNVGPSYIFRNTFVGNVVTHGIDLTVGPFYLSKNVIINSTSGGIQCDACITLSNLVSSNNLVGTSSASIVDSNGFLTTNYKSYVGSRGWEIGSSVTPMPPLTISIQ